MKPIFLFDDSAIDAHLRRLSMGRSLQRPAPRRHQKEALKMYLGTIAWFNKDKNFGAVRPDAMIDGIDRDEDIFIPPGVARKTGLSSQITQGQRVEFGLRPSRRDQGKMEVDHIRILDPIAAAA
jgi:cold shock CspA family protein